MCCMRDKEEQQERETLSGGDTIEISHHRISALINVYLKNIRAQLGIGAKEQHVSEAIERHISKYNLDDVLHDRIAKEKRKLKKS